jgi:phosphatidylglycerol:prolipoprotein diacylglycerol transferase
MGISLGLAHIASGEAFGAATRMPWGIFIWGEMRHPTQIYETILACLILVALLLLEKSKYSRTSGGIFWAFIGMSSAARLFIEAFRGDSTLILGSFRQDQVLAWFILVVSLYGLYRRLDFPDLREQSPS